MMEMNIKDIKEREVVDVILEDFSISIINKKQVFCNKKSNKEEEHIQSNNNTSSNKDILRPVTTIINGGSLFAILGGSGSGKTTLLNVIYI